MYSSSTRRDYSPQYVRIIRARAFSYIPGTPLGNSAGTVAPLSTYERSDYSCQNILSWTSFADTACEGGKCWRETLIEYLGKSTKDSGKNVNTPPHKRIPL